MKYVIVGGGIAGVSCANEILGLERSPELEVVLVSGSSFVKSVENYRKIGQYGEKFDVKEDVKKFVQNRLLAGRTDGKKHDGVQKHLQFSTSSVNSEKLQGPALGPDWCSRIDFGIVNYEKRSIRILQKSGISRRTGVFDLCEK